MSKERPIALVVPKQSKMIVVDCPFCGDVHEHRRAFHDPKQPGEACGWRMAHCRVGEGGEYELVVAPAGTQALGPFPTGIDRNGNLVLLPRRKRPKKDEVF